MSKEYKKEYLSFSSIILIVGLLLMFTFFSYHIGYNTGAGETYGPAYWQGYFKGNQDSFPTQEEMNELCQKFGYDQGYLSSYICPKEITCLRNEVKDGEHTSVTRCLRPYEKAVWNDPGGGSVYNLR